MSSFLTDPETTGQNASARPPIWAEGKQRARLNLAAFMRVSLGSTRVWLTPRLCAASRGALALSLRVEDGNYAALAARLGRAAQLVPGRERVAWGLDGMAQLLALAAETANGPAPLEPLPFRGWDGAVIVAPPEPPQAKAPPPAVAAKEQPAPAKRTRRHVRPAPIPAPRPRQEAPEGERDTLEAIRSAIHLAEVVPVRPAGRGARHALLVPPELRGADALPYLAPALPPDPGLVQRLAGQALGYVFIGCAMPVGLAQAAIAVVRGEDLRLRE